MPPKKKEAQKMSLGDFLQDESYGGSWADEVEDTYTGTQALPPADRRTMSSSAWGQNNDRDRSYAPRNLGPTELPDKPPYTAHLGNLSYDATSEAVTEFFEGCEIINVRIIEDREQQRPKGFAYAEFASVDGLKKALTLDGTSFQGRTIKVKIADPPRDRDGRGGDSNRDFSDWTRKGPLADLPGRGGNDRRPSEFGERRSEFGERRSEFGGERRSELGERRAPREQVDDGKVRDFGNWERRGPLSPLPQQERPPGSRDGSRPRMTEGSRSESVRDRRQSPAAWGEGQAPRQEGSRPPRREMADRPDRPERAPTAAEKDVHWRNNMRPDAAAAKSPEQSRDGSEAPSSPVPGQSPITGPAGRPKLNLAKRTVSETPDLLSPSGGEAKASIFGGARPIDTATREREIEEKRQQQLKEKREADEKAKEERRLAKEAAAKEAAAKETAAKETADKEAADKAEKAEADAAKQSEEKPESVKAEPAEPAKEDDSGKEARNGASAEQKLPVRSREPREPREPRENAPHNKSRVSEGGSWRQPSGEQRPPRGPPTGPRRGGERPPRGPRHEGARPPRANGSPGGGKEPTTPVTGEGGPASPEDDGWTTVNKTRGRK